MKILFAASEGVPYCKTGGLADVVGALPQTLAAKRHNLRVVLPFYRQIRESFPKLKFTRKTVYVFFDGRREPIGIWQASIRPNLKYYFADAPKFFDRPGVYGETPSTSYSDNDRRYAFFSRAVFEIAKAMSFSPDIIHAHDWQTGLVPAYLKFIYSKDRFFSKTASLFTVHNMAYQGNFPKESFEMTGLPLSEYHIKGVEFYGMVSFLKSGLVYADALNTVSPSYAKETRTDKTFGCGLEGVLQERATDYEGIVNGIDTKFWDPESDRLIAASFNAKTLARRAACKADLQKASGLSVKANVPLLSFIGRLDYQKGVDIFIEAAPSVLKNGVQMVCLGQGNLAYARALADLEKRYPAQVYIRGDFAEDFAHKIYAGSDIFMMPSRFEPCGLGQLIAMRYGSVPVVTPTGGLLDTVKDAAKVSDGTGFVARGMAASDFLSALLSALAAHKDERAWRGIQERMMTQDFSWKKSVADYTLIYESVLRR